MVGAKERQGTGLVLEVACGFTSRLRSFKVILPLKENIPLLTWPFALFAFLVLLLCSSVFACVIWLIELSKSPSF